MALKNFQYNRILQQYDERRFQNKHLLTMRYEEVIKQIPEFAELDREIVKNGITYAKQALIEGTSHTDELSMKNKVLIEKKTALLEQHGFPRNYLAPVYNCPDCKDTGFIEGEKCHCFKQAIVDLLYQQANLDTILSKENFHTFRYDFYSDDYVEPTTKLTPLANITKIVHECQNFITDFDKEYSNILLYGNTGVGKTFLANCIAKELLDSAHTVVYLTSFQLFDILEKHKFSRQIEQKTEADYQFQYIFDCDLLIIDDLGTETVNSFIASQLYHCINERHLSHKSTIISTNLSLDDLSRLYSERVFSRIISNYRLLKIIGDDIRLKKAFTP